MWISLRYFNFGIIFEVVVQKTHLSQVKIYTLHLGESTPHIIKLIKMNYELENFENKKISIKIANKNYLLRAFSLH
jgi:hypothetical protein